MHDENLGLSLDMLSLRSEILALLNGKKKKKDISDNRRGQDVLNGDVQKSQVLLIGIICIMFKEV